MKLFKLILGGKAQRLTKTVGDLRRRRRLSAREAEMLLNTLLDPTPRNISFVRDRVGRFK